MGARKAANAGRTTSVTPAWFYQSYLRARYKVSDPTIWRWVKAKYLPKPIKIGPNGKINAWTPKQLQEFEAKHGIVIDD